jgi:hypothetical protein
MIAYGISHGRRIPKPVDAGALNQRQRDALWRFTERHCRLPRSQFERDLADCDRVYLFTQGADRVTGLVALRTVRDTGTPKPLTFLYGYWTMLDPALRGSHIPQRCVLDAFLRCKARAPLRPVWCMYTSASFMSYLMATRTTARYWPRLTGSTPRDVLAFRDRIMTVLEGDAYDPARGIRVGRGSLDYPEAELGDGLRARHAPDVVAWLRLNPGYRHGDELVVLFPMDATNLLASGLKMLARRARRAFSSVLPAARSAASLRRAPNDSG